MNEALRSFQASAGLVKMARPDQGSFVPFEQPQPATRQGQREIVAATLAAGLLAADHGRMPTVEAAVALWREVLGEIAGD